MASVEIQNLLDHLGNLENAFEDSDTNDNTTTLRFLIIFILPFLRHILELHVEQEDFNFSLKNLDKEVTKMISDLYPSDLHFARDEDSKLSFSTKVQFWVSNLVQFASKSGSLFLQVSRSMNWKKAEILLEIVRSLLPSVEYLSIFTTTKKIPVEEAKSVMQEVEFMRNFLVLIKNRCFFESEDALLLFLSVEDLTIELSTALCFLALKEEHKYYANTGTVLGDMLDKTKSLQLVIKGIYDQSWEAQLGHGTPAVDENVLGFCDFLIEKLRSLSRRNRKYIMVDVRDQVDILVDELCFLRNTVMDLLLQAPDRAEMDSLITCSQVLIIETGYLVYVYDDNDMEDDTLMHFCSDICNLLESVDAIKRIADGVCSCLISSSRTFHRPTAKELEFVDFFIKKLERRMNSEEASLKREIETFHEEIVSVRQYFCEGDSQMQCFVESLKNAAYLANYVICLYDVEDGEGLLWHQKLAMFVATKDVKIVKKGVRVAISKRMHIHDPLQAMRALALEDKFQGRIQDTPDKLVGFKDVEKEVLDLLTGRSKQLKIISIVGMPGLGKSTLADSLYMHPSTVGCFHVRAWCRISQFYDEESCLFELLNQIVHEMNEQDDLCGHDARLKLYQALKGRRYLIILDDIWDSKVWYDLKATFPDDGNGSRILLTTRHRVVAQAADSLTYFLRLLTNKESCDLLWFKLFGSETCPEELLVISKHIARRCRGLPLSVVLIAGVLRRTKGDKASWEEVVRTFFGSVYTIRGKGKFMPRVEYISVLESSYMHLPNQLKPCFLYLGAFPRRTAIPISRLIRLWICEGLVQETNSSAPLSLRRSLEQAAKECLNGLIDRSLVMVARRSSLGGVKTCFVHDVLRAFCSQKLVEERSLKQQNKVGGTSIAYSGSQNYPRSFLYDHNSNRVMISGNEEWTCIPFSSGDTPLGLKVRKGYTSDRVLRLRKSIMRRVVLTEGAALASSTSRLIDYHFIFSCKFLKVLDLANVRVENSADTYDLVEIFELIHLTYLAIRVITSEIPSQIANLRDLETFILQGPIGEVIMPEALWSLVSLSHVLTDISFFSFQHYSQDFLEDITQLDMLKSISTLSLSHGDVVERLFLRRLTDIRKLGCRVTNSWDDSSGYNLLPVLQFLSKLESLKVFFSSKVLTPCKFSFPSHLKKLSLSNSRLPWDQMSVIMEQLPNLEVLKLLNKAFEGPRWDMIDGDILFPKLKFLKLDSLDIQFWNVEDESPPSSLEQLVVLNCLNLEEVPYSFGEIPTLQLIEMKWCSSSAMDTVKNILQLQRDLSNDDLKVTLIGSA